MLSKINKIISIENKNSIACIKLVHELNTCIAESEMDLPQIKHLPTTLNETLLKLRNKITK